MRHGSQMLMMLALAFPMLVPAQDVDQALDHAEQALLGGSYLAAEQEYRALTHAYPGLAEASSGLATALTHLERSDEAAMLLLEAGQGLVQAQEVELGVGFLERAAQLTPQSSAVRAALGYAYLQSQRHLEAIRELTMALEQGNSEPLVGLYLAASYWEAGEFESAEEIYGTLVRRSDGAGSAARRSLGALLLFRGQPDRAVPILLAAVGEDPTSAMLRFDLGRALEQSGRQVEARDVLTLLVRDEPDFYQAHYLLARSWRKSGELDRASDHLAKFQEMHAVNQAQIRQVGLDEARLLNGWELIRNEQHKEAERLFRSLPRSADSLRGLAEAQHRQGQRSGAIATLRNLLRIEPDRGDIALLIDRWELMEARP